MKENATIVFPDGNKAYEGDIEDGYLNGNGTLYYRDTQTMQYIGEWRQNLPEGAGKAFHPDGTLRYEGEWKAGLRNGQGKLFDETGALKYDGEWKADRAHGKGTLYFVSGEVAYTGNFAFDKREGYGEEFREEDGKPGYKGEWKDNRPEGRGVKFHTNGQRWYEGTFTAGESDGNGTAYYEDGKVAYEGQWKNGLRHGLGKLYGMDGHLEYYGPWKNGDMSEEIQKVENPIESVKAEDKQEVLARYPNTPKVLDSGQLVVKTSSCVTPFLLPFSDTEKNWNPFVATLKQYESNQALRYEDSILKNFYDSYPRDNLQQAFLLPTKKELKPLWGLKPFSAFPMPWTKPEAYARILLTNKIIRYQDQAFPTNAQNIAETTKMVFDLCANRPLSTWVPNYSPQNFGNTNRPIFFEYGPIPESHGEALFRKLVGVYESVRTIGYLPGLFPNGGFSGTLLLTQGKYRFVVESGLFLLTALAALGFDEITASVSSDSYGIIDGENLPHLPFVEKGVYSVETAQILFDQAFLGFKEKIAGQ